MLQEYNDITMYEIIEVQSNTYSGISLSIYRFQNAITTLHIPNLSETYN